MDADTLLPHGQVLSEQSYLVSRGVRPLSVAGHCHADPGVLLRVATRIEEASGENVVPFVLDHGDGSASFGYAGSRWALELYEWAVKDPLVPQEQRDRIVGLLLGYSVSAVDRYENEISGRRFELLPTSPARAAS